MSSITLKLDRDLIQGWCDEWAFEAHHVSDRGWSARIDVGGTAISVHQVPSAGTALLRAAVAAQGAVTSAQEQRALEELLPVAVWCVERAP